MKRQLIKTKDGRYWEIADSPIKEGFAIAFPVGGGFQCRIPAADVEVWNASIPETYRFGWVGFDNERYVQAYYNPHDRWNGWLKPLVDKANLIKFIEQQNRYYSECKDDQIIHGKLMADESVVCWQREGEQHTERATTITVNGIAREVYDISHGLIWEEADPPKIEKRFVVLLGAWREAYPDCISAYTIGQTEAGNVMLWDRQEQKPVATLFAEYAQAYYLDQISDWFNDLTNQELEREGILGTKL